MAPNFADRQQVEGFARLLAHPGINPIRRPTSAHLDRGLGPDCRGPSPATSAGAWWHGPEPEGNALVWLTAPVPTAVATCRGHFCHPPWIFSSLSL